MSLYVYLVEEQYPIGDDRWASRTIGSYTTHTQAHRHERLRVMLLDEENEKNGENSDIQIRIKILEVHNKFEEDPEFNFIRKPKEWSDKYGM